MFCRACGETMDSKFCPNCGETSHTISPVSMVELTSKKWKSAQAGGCLMTIVGIIMVPIGNETSAPIGSIIMLGGVVICIYGFIGAWWNHK